MHRSSSTPGGGGAGHPWKIVNTGGDTCAVTQPILVSSVQTGDTVTPTGLTGLALAGDKTYWLKASFTAGAITGWSIDTTGPTGNRLVFSTTGPTYYQTELWYPLARSYSGSHPELSGFDFIPTGSTITLHLEQLCSTPLALTRVVVDGYGGLYPRPT